MSSNRVARLWPYWPVRVRSAQTKRARFCTVTARSMPIRRSPKRQSMVQAPATMRLIPPIPIMAWPQTTARASSRSRPAWIRASPERSTAPMCAGRMLARNRISPAHRPHWLVRCRENKSSGDERGVDDQAQRSLVLAGNPVAGTGDQVEVVTVVVAEDVLQGSGLRRVEGHLRHPVAKGVALIVYYQHLIAAV